MVNSSLTATVYVNPVTGSDTNNGSRLSPFKSLTHTLNSVRPPVIIQLGSGIYHAPNGEVFPLIVPGGVWIVGNEANKGGGILIEGSGDYQTKSFGLQNITLVLASNAQLMGVTVTNPINKGTGVWIESTSPTVANNTFIKCRREGIFISGNAKPAILDNIFFQNASAGLVMARNSKGEVLRNVMQKNPIGIAISDFAAPLVANNKIWSNRTGIALSREARPVLRNNLIADNFSGGLLLNGNSTPDLGSYQDPAGNTFRDNNEYDIQNATSSKLVSAGNLLNPTLVKGLVEFVATTTDSPKQLSVNSSFPDLNGHWAALFIEALYEKGLISGDQNGTFAPEAPISRAAYAAVISNTFKFALKNKVSKFTDIPADFWAAPAIYRSASMGFIGGFPDGSFRPDQNLSKIQAIVSIVRGLKLKGGKPNILTTYRDRAQIPSYATNAMAIATQKLLVVNYPQTEQLEPLRDISRAEVVALIYQALVLLGKQKAIVSPYIVKPDVDIPSFTDLTAHWAEPFIRSLVSLDLTGGYADGTYKPDTPMTRAQYAALIVKAFNPTPKRYLGDFFDIPPIFWAYKAIKAAAQGGFVGGFSDGTFRPQEKVQRLQVIVSLVNGLGLPTAHDRVLHNFTDAQTLPKYARTAVATATQQRIVVNYPDPLKIEPKREATRAEVAAMVYQALVAIKRTPPINSPYIIFPTGN
ncbi:MAG: S-layer homology domain-containing protein [Cyanobacteria bacterium J06635_10]